MATYNYSASPFVAVKTKIDNFRTKLIINNWGYVADNYNFLRTTIIKQHQLKLFSRRRDNVTPNILVEKMTCSNSSHVTAPYKLSFY